MKSTARRKASSASSRRSSRIAYKLHRRGGELVLAACDAALVGGSWSEGVLRLCAPPLFYSELACDDPRVLINLAAACTQGNLVGEAVVAAFIEEGFVDEETVIRVEGVPHAIFVRMLE